jgi:hypothetical protein
VQLFSFEFAGSFLLKQIADALLQLSNLVILLVTYLVQSRQLI